MARLLDSRPRLTHPPSRSSHSTTIRPADSPCAPSGPPRFRSRTTTAAGVADHQLLGTSQSATSLQPVECVPSQNGFLVDPPQRHSANGRLGI